MFWFLTIVVVGLVVTQISQSRENSELRHAISGLQTDLLAARASIANIDRFILFSKALHNDRKAYNAQPYIPESKENRFEQGLSSDHWAQFNDHLRFAEWSLKELDADRERKLEADPASLSAMLDNMHDRDYSNAKEDFRGKIRPHMKTIKIGFRDEHSKWLERTERPDWFLRWLIAEAEQKDVNQKSVAELKKLLSGEAA